MKKNNASLWAACAAALLSSSLFAAEIPSVAITSIVEHPSLDATHKGVIDALSAEGFSEDKIKIQFQSAQGNPATAGQIARKFIGDQPNAIVAIATPSAQAIVAATKTIPVVFSAVTDPVAAKLVSSWQASGTNVTGVSDMLPLEPQIDLILKIKPDAKRIGMVFSPGEVNSTIVVKEMKAALEKRGLTLVDVAAARSVDVATAAKSLVGKVDVVYTSLDNNVVSAFESLVAVTNQAKIPVIAAESDSVKRGAVGSLGVNYYDMGRQTGGIVARILKGEKPGNIAPQRGDKLSLTLNLQAAKTLGITLSESLLKEAQNTLK